MNKKYIVIIIAAILVAAGALGWNAYYSGIDAGDVPVTPVKVSEQDVLPIGADITVPLLGGLIKKPLDCIVDTGGSSWFVVPEGAVFDRADTASDLGLVGEVPYSLDITLPVSLNWSVSLVHKDASGKETPVLVSGSLGDAQTDVLGDNDNIVLKKAGDYSLMLQGEFGEDSENVPYGKVYYTAFLSVKNPDPVFTPGRTELAQGDILSLKLENVPDGQTPELETELGKAIFTPGVPDAQDGIAAEGFSSWYAAVPVSNTRAPGEYPVTLRAGELVYDVTVTVSAYDFEFQNLIIDTSVPSVATAVTSEAYEEFAAKVTPLWSQFEPERYWEGLFVMPVDLGERGFISTTFGETRITNGNENTRRSHNGIDYAVATGTPVRAGGAGKVVLAEFLLNTGNTVIIDHGGGLKSISYHMDSLDTETGAIVAQGDLIGKVGSTGYSTGPHLHYEMRIGDQPVSPSMLYAPDAGLYSAEQ